MSALVALVNAAEALGYRVEEVSERRIALIHVDGGHLTLITIDSSNLSARLLTALLQDMRDASDG